MCRNDVKIFHDVHLATGCGLRLVVELLRRMRSWMGVSAIILFSVSSGASWKSLVMETKKLDDYRLSENQEVDTHVVKGLKVADF